MEHFLANYAGQSAPKWTKTATELIQQQKSYEQIKSEHVYINKLKRSSKQNCHSYLVPSLNSEVTDDCLDVSSTI
jgi:hypothetical protein